MGSLEESRGAEPDAPSSERIDSQAEVELARGTEALAKRAWTDLPYSLMRLTSKRAPHQKPFYWRDLALFLGEAQMKLARIELPEKAARYSATYFSCDASKDVTVSPLLEDGELYWLAPGNSAADKVTTQQLAAILLTKLVTFERLNSGPGKDRPGY